MDKIFNFDDMAKSGPKTAKAIAKQFAALGVPVAGEPAIDPRVRRSSGISYREVKLTFKDSQSVVLRVKQTGDIYQVLVNGRDIPIRHQDDQKRALVDIADALNARRAAFQKKLAAVKVPIKSRGATVTKRAVIVQLTKRSAELSETIDEARVELSALKSGKEPVVPDVSAEQLATNAEEAQWLARVATGDIDISGDLKGARDRIRRAQKTPGLEEASERAAVALKEAAVAKAREITGAELDDAAEAANAVAGAPSTPALPNAAPTAELSQATPAARPLTPPQAGAFSVVCPGCGEEYTSQADGSARLDDAAATANAIVQAPSEAKLPQTEAVESQATPAARPVEAPAVVPATLCPKCVAANTPKPAHDPNAAAVELDTAAETSTEIAEAGNDARLPHAAPGTPESQATRAAAAPEGPNLPPAEKPTTQEQDELSAEEQAEEQKKLLANEPGGSSTTMP